jgi:EAL domain-containing protein (putative c-di-GMP-specific phosphodiesterase class I)
VEDGDALEELRRLGCDFAQGYKISPPLAEKAFQAWWAIHAQTP